MDICLDLGQMAASLIVIAGPCYSTSTLALLTIKLLILSPSVWLQFVILIRIPRSEGMWFFNLLKSEHRMHWLWLELRAPNLRVYPSETAVLRFKGSWMIFYQMYPGIILVTSKYNKRNEFYRNKNDLRKTTTWYSFKYNGRVHVRLGGFHSNDNCAKQFCKYQWLQLNIYTYLFTVGISVEIAFQKSKKQKSQ